MGIEALLGLALQYGIPQVLLAIQSWRTTNSGDPTFQDIQGLMVGVVPPTDYSKPVPAPASPGVTP